ncbi:DUF485 domain-containing protein [Spirillospora sp. NPDC052269]
MARDERFLLLRRRFARLALAVAASFLGWYFLYVALSAFARDLMARPVTGNINVALVLGVLQFVSTFALAWYYARYAAESLDPIATALREEADAPAAIRAAPRRSALRSPAAEDEPAPERRPKAVLVSAEEPTAFTDEPEDAVEDGLTVEVAVEVAVDPSLNGRPDRPVEVAGSTTTQPLPKTESPKPPQAPVKHDSERREKEPEEELAEVVLAGPQRSPENVPGPLDDLVKEAADSASTPARDDTDPPPGLNDAAPATSANGADPVSTANGADSVSTVNGADSIPSENGVGPVPSVNGVSPVPSVNGADSVSNVNGTDPVPSAAEAEPVPNETEAEPVPSANGAEPVPSMNGAARNGAPGPVPGPAKPKDDVPDARSGTGARPDPGWLR